MCVTLSSQNPCLDFFFLNDFATIFFILLVQYEDTGVYLKKCLLLFMTNMTCDDNDNGPILNEGDDYIFLGLNCFCLAYKSKLN